MTIRLFVAIEIGEEEKKALGRIQARLRHRLPFVRWVKPDAIHLTLRFMGDTDENDVPGVTDALLHAAAESVTFALTLRELGAFPSEKRPRVLWVGVEEPSGALAALAGRLNARLVSAGFPPDNRPFSPHITIGRVRERVGADCTAVLSAFQGAKAGGGCVCEVCLFRSELTPEGPLHTVLCRAPLKA